MSSTTRTVLLAALNLAIILVYAFGSSRWVTTGDSWYRGLREPEWQPPDAVFGIAWTYNFTMLAIVGAVVGAQGSNTQRWLWFALLVTGVAAALSWAWLFYSQHQLAGAAVALTIAAVLTVALTVVAWQVNRWCGVAMAPYATWVCLAASLSVRYAMLN